MKSRYKKIPVLFGLCAAGLLTGCGAKNTQVHIMDGRQNTEILVAGNTTVAEVLKEAEITVDDKDTVTPALDSVVKNQSEIQIERHAAVTLVEGDQTEEVEMTGKTVQDVLDEKGVELKEHDYVNHSLDAYLEDGMEIQVIHRLAVTIQVDGETKEYLTEAKNVADLLEEQSIAVDKKDIVKPGMERELSEGTKVVIERVSVKQVVEKEKVPFETEVEYSGSMYSDESVEKTPGVEGEKEVTYEVTYVDGKEDHRKAVSEKMLKEPVSQVVTKGTKQRRRIVSKQKVEDCDGSGHGYYIITWSDGKVEYQDY